MILDSCEVLLSETGAPWLAEWLADGKHIAATIPADTPEARKAQNQVTFLMNFSDELRRKVPIGK